MMAPSIIFLWPNIVFVKITPLLKELEAVRQRIWTRGFGCHFHETCGWSVTDAHDAKRLLGSEFTKIKFPETVFLRYLGQTSIDFSF